MVVLLFFLSNNLFFFHLLGNFLYVVRCIFWETIVDDVILDFLCAYLAHHIVCASNSRIIYYSIMLILNKEIIATVFSWREIDFGEVRSITLVVFLSLSKECIVVAVIFELVETVCSIGSSGDTPLKRNTSLGLSLAFALPLDFVPGLFSAAWHQYAG